MSILAEDSGGFVVMDNNEIDRGFRRIVVENSSYYLLAYYSSHPRDDKFHRINVRVTRPRVTVRARRGYLSEDREPLRRIAADNQVSEGIIDALRSPVQLSNLRMRVFAAPFRAAPQASVLVGIELVGRDLPLETNGTLADPYVAIDEKGKEHGWRNDRLRLNLQPETRQRVEQGGVIALKRIDLPPGRYRLQVAASDPVRSVAGSVISDLEVPDFEKATFAMSGLLVTSRSGDVLTAYADEQIKDVLPTPPIASRTFPQDDEIAAFAEIYGDNVSPHQVDIVTTVRSATGAAVFEETEERASSELQTTRTVSIATSPASRSRPSNLGTTLEPRSTVAAEPESRGGAPRAVHGDCDRADAVEAMRYRSLAVATLAWVLAECPGVAQGRGEYLALLDQYRERTDDGRRCGTGGVARSPRANRDQVAGSGVSSFARASAYRRPAPRRGGVRQCEP